MKIKSFIVNIAMISVISFSFSNLSYAIDNESKASILRSWTNELASMPTPRRNLSSVAYENKIYAMGGIEGRADSNKVEIYDIETDTWSTGIDLPVEKYSFESVLYKDKIYTIGGYNKTDGLLTRVDVFDLKTNTWSTVSEMPTPRSSFVAEVYNNKIYCIAGETYEGYTGKMEVYDIETNTWTEGKPLSVPRGDIDGVIYEDKIYCVGGYDGTLARNEVEVYDIKSNTWNTASSLNESRYSLTNVIYRNEIYAIGGYGLAHNALNTVEVYDVNTDTWKLVDDMVSAKGGATGQSYYGKVYLIGGHDDITDVSSNLTFVSAMPSINEIAVDAVEKAEDSRSEGDISVAYMFTGKVDEVLLKDSLTRRLDFLTEKMTPSNITSSVDIYIKSENMLSLSLDTNSITFEDFSGVEDIEKLNVVNITVNSSLPYELNSYLETEIQNADATKTMDKSVLNIKSSVDSDYKEFVTVGNKLMLADNQIAGNDIKHSVDLKLKGSLAHKADVYKTVIKFEVKQK